MSVKSEERETGKPALEQADNRRRVPRVVVVGAGFGGLNVIRNLAGKDAVEVLVLDRNNYHGFWPLLYQVATAELMPDAIAYPVREIIHKFPNVRFQMAEVNKVDLQNKQVLTDGDPVDYDYLVLAAGSANNYFGNAVIPKNTYSLKDVDQAVELRQGLLATFEAAVRETDNAKRTKLLTFVLVGSGPTGVELAGAFAELIRPVIKKDYPGLDPDEIKILLLEAHDTLLSSFPKNLQQKAQKRLEKMGIEIQPHSEVTNIEDGVISLKNGQKLEAGTVVWTAGVRAAELGETLNLKLAHSKRVPVQATLNLANHPEVFVIGDMAYLEGYKASKEAYPMLAPVAIQQGKLAAHNILASINHHPPEVFHYFDKGNLATIGRKAAIADAFGLQLSGWVAWLVWLVVHLFYLIGFRNRLLVMTSWAYNYLTYNLGVRLLGGRNKKLLY